MHIASLHAAKFRRSSTKSASSVPAPLNTIHGSNRPVAPLVDLEALAVQPAMAEDNQFASPKNDLAHLDAGEDAEMRAARRELKQSSISDPPPSTRDSGHDSAAEERADACAATPAGDVSDVQNEDLMIKMSSPKKKRAHDQLDGDMQAKDNDSTSTASTDSAKDRASRLEPEKKRHRDQESGDASLVRPV